MKVKEIEMFGKFIKDFRKASGKSLRDVEREAGMKHSIIYRLEKGFDCRFSSVIKMTKYLERQVPKVSIKLLVQLQQMKRITKSLNL